jgi:hypothetical protein
MAAVAAALGGGTDGVAFFDVHGEGFHGDHSPSCWRGGVRAITVNDGLIVAVNDVRGTLSP